MEKNKKILAANKKNETTTKKADIKWLNWELIEYLIKW